MAATVEHVAVDVMRVDGWIQVVTCSCTSKSKPTTHEWARSHFAGSFEDGWALLESIVANQSKRARVESPDA